jgi:hypothetical protein
MPAETHLAAVLGPTLDIVTGIVAFVALGTAFLYKVVIPGAKGITTFNEKIVPNAKYMPHLAKLDAMESVLDDIGSQFKTNEGSSLKDDIIQVRRDIAQLGEYAEENRQAAADAKLAAAEAKTAAAAAEAAAIAAADSATRYAAANAAGINALEILVGTIKEHAKDDRDLARGDRDLARDALRQMVELTASAARTEESGVRQEAAGELAKESRQRTEASGARIEEAGRVVAEDLAATQKRADDVHPDEAPGAAADAASQSPEE